jgi:hypothetical protein
VKALPQIVKIESHRNNPALSGWLGFGLAALCFGISFSGMDSPQAQLWLRALAAMFFGIGCAVLVWAPRRSVTIDPETCQIRIEDSSCFGKKHRTISFDEVAEVVAEEWKDPDPDIRPLKRTLHWVGLRLHSGEMIDLTDQCLSKPTVLALRSRLANILDSRFPEKNEDRS